MSTIAMYAILQRRLDSQLAHVRSVRFHVTLDDCACDFYEREFCRNPLSVQKQSRLSCGLRYLDGNINCVSVPVLECGDKHVYTVPSFPVLSVEIRKFILPEESFVVVDGFIRDDPSLERTYPAELYVETNSSNAC